jgi:hypothetical protein
MNRIVLSSISAALTGAIRLSAKSGLRIARRKHLNLVQVVQVISRCGAVECRPAGQLASPTIDRFISRGGFIPCIRAVAAL